MMARPSKSRNKILLLIIIVAFFATISMSERASYAYTRLVYYLSVPFRPIGAALNYFDALPIFGFSQKWRLAQENIELKTRVAQLGVSAGRLAAIEDENTKLREQLGNFESQDYILADVVSSLAASPIDAFVINVGSDQEVTPGKLVLTEEAVAVGKIAEVYPKFSKVLMFSAFGQTEEVVLNDTHVNLTGAGGQNFFISLPKTFELKEGDLAFLPSPRHEAFARVGRVEETENSPFKNVYLRLPVNMLRLSRLYVAR